MRTNQKNLYSGPVVSTAAVVNLSSPGVDRRWRLTHILASYDDPALATGKITVTADPDGTPEVLLEQFGARHDIRTPDGIQTPAGKAIRVTLLGVASKTGRLNLTAVAE